MDDLNAPLQRLGAAVAGASDRLAVGSTATALDRARRAFVAGTPTPVRRSAWIPALAAAGFAVLAALGVVVWRTRVPVGPPPISFAVGSGSAGVVGEWVAAGAEAPLAATFSDGSKLELAPGARMRVTTTSATGADVLIERGLVRAAVAHPSQVPTRWAVRAGPFEVRVTGTKFDAAWDPMSETFELTMLEGRVLVVGPHIPPERMVVAGERLVVSVRDGRMVLSTASKEPEPPRAPPPAVANDPAPKPSASTSAAANAPASSASAPGTLGWKELATKGKYRDAFSAVEPAFNQEIERVPASDVLLLADAARFAGSPGRARDALLAARRRFSVRGQSAFLIGKIAADQQSSPGDAVGWFETYLREEPNGPLAEQALGRIFDLTRRSSPDGARRAAARYLARYPEGSYAALARSVCAEGGGTACSRSASPP